MDAYCDLALWQSAGATAGSGAGNSHEKAACKWSGRAMRKRLRTAPTINGQEVTVDYSDLSNLSAAGRGRTSIRRSKRIAGALDALEPGGGQQRCTLRGDRRSDRWRIIEQGGCRDERSAFVPDEFALR